MTDKVLLEVQYSEKVCKDGLELAEKKLKKAQARLADIYSLAIEKGDSNAALYLASMYYNGEGINKDYVKAAKLLKLAYKKGEDCSHLARSLYYNYRDGDGVVKDDKEAAFLLKISNHDIYIDGELPVTVRDFDYARLQEAHTCLPSNKIVCNLIFIFVQCFKEGLKEG